MRHCLIFIAFVLFLVACGDGNNGDSSFSNKNLAITVSGSRSFNPNIVHGQIDYYQITVTGEDLVTPFVQRFSGEASAARMLGIPTGTGRRIVVEAFNPNGLVIRRGEAEGVAIVPNQLSHVELVMHSVPIFTNLGNKSAVVAGRLAFGIFGEPGSSLEILEIDGDGTNPVADQKSGNATVDTSGLDGLFRHWPGDQYDTGIHTFRVRDQKTDEASDIALLFCEKTVRPGITVTAGGLVRRLGDELIVTNTGQSYFGEVEIGGESLGESAFLDVVDLMY